jgi:hypothetical protein
MRNCPQLFTQKRRTEQKQGFMVKTMNGINSVGEENVVGADE